ncbi:MAG TPA: hypothetical protein DDX54_05635 [Rhodospirillaceae bacterium]|jgi:hypothetical protein|nr:hypothetical protein [Rhodospirillaceae bacterium]
MGLFVLSARQNEVVLEEDTLRAGERTVTRREARAFLEWADTERQNPPVRGMTEDETDAVLDKMSAALHGVRPLQEVIAEIEAGALHAA